MFLSKCLFGFILLTKWPGVGASPAHLGITKMPFVRVPDPTYTNALYIDRLAKRGGTVIVQLEHGYYCAFLITSSRSTFKIAVDTGSAYTWVGAAQDNPYIDGFASRPTGIATGCLFQVHCNFRGRYNDTIALGGLIVAPQGIGVPTALKKSPDDIDGILGLGPARLTAGMSSDGKLIPTVLDNLYSQGIISSPLLGVYFMPKNVGTSGLLSFGDVRRTVLTSDVRYVPVTTTSPANNGWGVDATIVYGSNMPILSFGSGILDTGSDRISISRDAFQAYMFATRASLRDRRLYLTEPLYNELQPLSILISGQSYKLSPNAQIRARSSSDSPIILVVQNRGPGPGIDFSLGAPFFQRYYVVFNSESNEVGFASHIHTDSTTN